MFQKNLIKLLIVTLSVFQMLNIKEVNALEFDTAYYVDVISNDEEFTIFFPSNQVKYLALSEEGQIINTSSNTVYGYLSNSPETLKFSTFSEPILIDYEGNENIFTINSIVETNISFMDNSNLFIFNYTDFIYICLIILFGGLLWLRLSRH